MEEHNHQHCQGSPLYATFTWYILRSTWPVALSSFSTILLALDWSVTPGFPSLLLRGVYWPDFRRDLGVTVSNDFLDDPPVLMLCKGSTSDVLLLPTPL